MATMRLVPQWKLAVAIFVISIAFPAWAEKPPKADKGKPHSSHQKKHGDFEHKTHLESKQQYRQRDRYEQQRYFNDQHRSIINSYYAEEFRRGFCPPGLAKKQNGCMPPGQTKRWSLGQPLPRDVVFYDLPDSVMRQIGYPPSGYRFVRVASDILMITVGTGLVVDAISDLSNMR